MWVDGRAVNNELWRVLEKITRACTGESLAWTPKGERDDA